jgi:hypothetical protein
MYNYKKFYTAPTVQCARGASRRIAVQAPFAHFFMYILWGRPETVIFCSGSHPLAVDSVSGFEAVRIRVYREKMQNNQSGLWNLTSVSKLATHTERNKVNGDH